MQYKKFVDKLQTLGAVYTRLFGGVSRRFRCVFGEEDATGLTPRKDDEQKRREICRNDAKSFLCRQPLQPIVKRLHVFSLGKQDGADGF